MKVSDMRQSDHRARIGLEPLEARNLQSALAVGAAASAPLILPPAETASAYQTTVWDRSDVGTGTAAEEDGFAKIKLGSDTLGGESSQIERGKATPILMGLGTVAEEDGSATLGGESSQIESGNKATPILF